jgi:hypothetical protein
MMPSALPKMPCLVAGAIVVSKRVGGKESFVGTIIGRHPGYWSGDYGPWVVRCPLGLHWHRTIDELRPYAEVVTTDDPAHHKARTSS